MRKYLLGFLMLVMLTPGLACGPFMGMDKAQAAQPMQGMEDCPGMGNMDGAQKTSKDESPMFFKDCLHVDLQSADHHADLKKPDTGKTFFIAWVDIVSSYVFTPSDFHAIRGPPPDWPDLSETQPSILLTTQRFRE
jgi:hypothetical protein